MDNVFILRLVLSFLIAGTWISLASLASERLGSRVGGLIANLPSNIVVSMLFMALSQGTEYAAAASASVPMGMAIDTLFLLALVMVLPFGLVPAMAAALGTWAVAAFLAIRLPLFAPFSESLSASVALYVAVTLVCFFIADVVLKIRAVPRKPGSFQLRTLIIRAVFAGTVVAGAVAISRFAPPTVTGILATFPAVLSSTMVILARSQGTGFARATGKMLILSSSNIIIYSVCVGLLFPILGPWAGTALSFLAAVAWVALFLPLSKKVR